MDTAYDLFEWETTIAISEPQVIAPRDEEAMAVYDDWNEDDMKKQAMKDAREALERWWVDLDYIIDNYMDAVENATTESYSWTLLKDHKTSVSALKQLTDLWKTAHGMDKKQAQEIVFKPIFNKPPKLN